MDLISLTGSFQTKDYRILISQVQSQSGQYRYTVWGKPNIPKINRYFIINSKCTYRGSILMIILSDADVARSTRVDPFSTKRLWAGPQRSEATLDLPFQQWTATPPAFGVGAVSARRPNTTSLIYIRSSTHSVTHADHCPRDTADALLNSE